MYFYVYYFKQAALSGNLCFISLGKWVDSHSDTPFNLFTAVSKYYATVVN